MAKEEPMQLSNYRSGEPPVFSCDVRGSNVVGYNVKDKVEISSKAQSHSDGKPSLCDIWKWLDQDFLLECAEQMKFPVEVMKKYPKDNWKQGVGDEQFIKARLESAQRHLTKLINADIMKEARDDETNKHETVCVMVNMMMMYHSMFGGK